jgi:hypothetical protein
MTNPNELFRPARASAGTGTAGDPPKISREAVRLYSCARAGDRKAAKELNRMFNRGRPWQCGIMEARLDNYDPPDHNWDEGTAANIRRQLEEACA